MNLGIEYGTTCIGDVYAYNREYDYCNDLLQKAVDNINPSENDCIYVLDLYSYEFHINGMQYKISWDLVNKRFTYDYLDKDSIVLKSETLLTKNIIDCSNPKKELGGDFYIIVAARINEDTAINTLRQKGYKIIDKTVFSNCYGEIKVYHLSTL